MPHYMIYHSCAISASQYQTLATAITKIHCDLFSAPSAFVNITFHSTASSSSSSTTTFVASRPVQTNFIHAHLRPRGPENGPKLRTLVTTMMSLWDAHINSGKTEGRLDDPRALHNVFIFEDLVAGAEQGFVLPTAGQDGNWVNDNMAEFERRAKGGDESMGRLIEEVKARGE